MENENCKIKSQLGLNSCEPQAIHFAFFISHSSFFIQPIFKPFHSQPYGQLRQSRLGGTFLVKRCGLLEQGFRVGI